MVAGEFEESFVAVIVRVSEALARAPKTRRVCMIDGFPIPSPPDPIST
jgi:hypothetical protein